MRKLLVFAILSLFMANTVIVSAWAQVCMHPDTSLNPTERSHNVPPCHQTNDTQQQSEDENQHCEGLCLCSHVSTSPSLFIKSTEAVRLPNSTKIVSFADQDRLESVSQTPPKRPPKHYARLFLIEAAHKKYVAKL